MSNLPEVLSHTHVLQKGLSGFTAVHNAIRGDYCVIECAKSMLTICDEVVVADCDSDDGTLQMLTKFASENPKVRIISIPWPSLPTYAQWKVDAPRPMNDNKFWPKLLNVVRLQLRYDWMLTMDADEVLMEYAQQPILDSVAAKEIRWMERINLWIDAKHQAPPGWVCGTFLARLGPTTLWMPSDEHWPDGEPEMRLKASKHPHIVCGHYGFLRKQDGFYAKSRVMQPAVAGTYDSRLEEAQAKGIDWWVLGTFPADILPYDGPHNPIILPWLRERGRI